MALSSDQSFNNKSDHHIIITHHGGPQDLESTSKKKIFMKVRKGMRFYNELQ